MGSTFDRLRYLIPLLYIWKNHFLLASAITSKFRIAANDTLLPLHAPAGFGEMLGTLPAGSKIDPRAKSANQVHWFVTSQAQLEKELSRVMKALAPGARLWVYFPKGGSGVQTDLSRDKGWDCINKETDKLIRINLVSLDSTWSAFGFRTRSEADKKKKTTRRSASAIADWADPVKRTVTLPPDLAKALPAKKKERRFFEQLSYTNRKEYVEWVVTAVKPETRAQRIGGVVERLANGWKNPRNQ